MKTGDVYMKYKEGDIVRGIVTGIESYGAFVKMDDGYTGLIHISEISNGFVKNVGSFLKIGEVIDVRVLKCFSDSKRLRLSVKGLNNYDRLGKISLEENGSGFEYLKRSLPFWIDSKMEEMKKSLKK